MEIIVSRILPIKIHELDLEDLDLLQSELGGVFRSIEFVFKAPGVHRPLNANEDHPHDNLAKVYYRDQLNKVANVIKEVITSLKNHSIHVQPVTKIGAAPPSTSKRKKPFILLSTAFLVILTSYFLYSKFYDSKRESSNSMTKEVSDKRSIAILPFRIIGEEKSQEYLGDGITEQIITNLSHLDELKVIAKTSVLKYKESTKNIRDIGKELNVTHVLEGSIQKSENHIRVTAKLVLVDDESYMWAKYFDKQMVDIFEVQDSVSVAIVNTLLEKLSQKQNKAIQSYRTTNIDAFEHFLKGQYGYDLFTTKLMETDFLMSEQELKKAIHNDTTYAVAYAALADLYNAAYTQKYAKNVDRRHQLKALRDKYSAMALRLEPENPYVNSIRALSFEQQGQDLDSIFKYRRKAYALAPNDARICAALSSEYLDIGLFNQSLSLREKCIKLDPNIGIHQMYLGETYMYMGDYLKAEKALKEALKLEPQSLAALRNLTSLYLFKGDCNEAELLLTQIKSINPDVKANYTGWDAWLLACNGKKEAALLLDKSEVILLTLGMKDEALKIIEKSNRNYLFLLHPIYNIIRNETRFKQVLKKQKEVYEVLLSKYAVELE